MKNDADRMLEIAELIKKQLLNEITDREMSILHAWLVEDPANRDLYQRFTKEGVFEEKEATLQRYETEKALDYVQDQIGEMSPVKSFRFTSLLKYAAVFIIPLLLGGYILTRYLDRETGNQLTETRLIPPGTGKAVLTLASGEEVILDQSRSRIIKGDKDVQILDTARILSYKTEKLYPFNKTRIAHAEKLPILFNTLETPRGGEYTLELSDGTRIWLNAESSLKYPARFLAGNREVELKGEAYFEVAENPKKPFIIHTGDLEIEVLGTSFNVMSYLDEESIETTLSEGSVKVSVRNEKAIKIVPGEQAVFSKMEQSMKIKEVDPSTYTDWKDGRYIIENQTLESLLRRLGRWYDFETTYISPEAKDYRFSGTLNRYEEVNRILDLISQTTDIGFEIAEKDLITITISEE